MTSGGGGAEGGTPALIGTWGAAGEGGGALGRYTLSAKTMGGVAPSSAADYELVSLEQADGRSAVAVRLAYAAACDGVGLVVCRDAPTRFILAYGKTNELAKLLRKTS